MKKMMECYRDIRGSGEAITFAATVIILMFVILQFYQPVKYMFQGLILENVHRSALLKMETTGGLTPSIEQDIKDWLNQFNFDLHNLVIKTSTPYPVQYGETVELTLTYKTTYTNYSLYQMTIASVDEPLQIKISRSSVSREYFK